MRPGGLVALLFAVLLLPGCGPAKPATPQAAAVAPVSIPDTVEVAGKFALAVGLSDGATLASLIPPDAAAEHRSEIETIKGTTIGSVTPSRSWNGSVLVLGLGGREYKVRPDSATEVIVTDGGASAKISLTQGASGWLVTSVNGEPSIRRVLSLSPAGAKCRLNLASIFLASYSARAEGDSRRSVKRLVPKYLKRVPVCESKGEYELDSNGDAVCTVHGSRLLIP